MTKARFAVGSVIQPGAQVYLTAVDGEGALTTDAAKADPRHKKPVGVIEPGPTFKLNADGEALLKVLE